MKKLKIDRKKLKKVALVSTCVVVFLLLSFGIYSFAFAKRVYPKQYLGGEKISGLSHQALIDHVKKTSEKALGSTIVLKSSDNSKEYVVNPAEISLTYDQNATVEQTWQTGRNKKVFEAMAEQLRSIFIKKNYNAIYSYNEESLKTKVATIATGLDQPEKDYSILYQGGKFVLQSDRAPGKRIDQNEIIANVKLQLSSFKIVPLSFSLKSYSPQITETSATETLANANKILTAGVLDLKADTTSFKIDLDTIGGFIVSAGHNDKLNLAMNPDRVNAYIAQLAKSIDVGPQDAKLTVTDGKVTVFQTSRTGLTLDQAQTARDIESALFARIANADKKIDSSVVVLKIAAAKPGVSSDTLSQYGLNELVGTATTSFYNSPSNRVQNITIGANSINGVLLKPGEEFSTIGHLGTIDASSGYLEELVIKDNKTLPEFGGGLCQVSSTLFRAALNAGLKITERTNHSYRVSYYEPPIGMDATIYDPAPDFKFVNNFSSYILIQSKIVGTKITFDLYGTKDSRIIEMSTPVASSYIDPPAPVKTPSTTLAPGEEKLVSHSHQGATADFHYKVTSAAGAVLQDKNFHSVYNAIPEQWLIGADVPVTPPVDTPAPQ